MRRVYTSKAEDAVLRTGEQAEVDKLFDQLMERAQTTADELGSPVEIWGSIVGHREFLLAVYPSA
jgi:hypothetical protein